MALGAAGRGDGGTARIQGKAQIDIGQRHLMARRLLLRQPDQFGFGARRIVGQRQPVAAIDFKNDAGHRQGMKYSDTIG